MEFYFKNSSGINLAKDDKVYLLDGNKYFMYIKRSNEADVSGIYSCKTGELVIAEGEFDDVILVSKTNTPILNKYARNDTSYYAITKDGKVGVYSPDGKCILPIAFKDIMFYYRGYLATVAEDDTCALYSDTGEMILPSKYKKMEMGYRASGRNFIRVHGEKNEIVVRDRKILFEALTKDVYDYGWFFIVQLDEKRFAVYTDRKVCEHEGKHRHMSNGYILVTNGNLKSVIYARDGSMPIQAGEYETVKKRRNELTAIKADGSAVSVEIANEKDV